MTVISIHTDLCEPKRKEELHRSIMLITRFTWVTPWLFAYEPGYHMDLIDDIAPWSGDCDTKQISDSETHEYSPVHNNHRVGACCSSVDLSVSPHILVP